MFLSLSPPTCPLELPVLTALLAVGLVALGTAGALLVTCIACQTGARVVRRLVAPRRPARTMSSRRVQVS